MGVTLGAPVPVATERKRESFTADELALGASILTAWTKLGTFATMAEAVAKSAQVGDGVAYADAKSARKVAGHVLSIMLRTLGTSKAGTIHVTTGPAVAGALTADGNPAPAGAVSWGMFFGPYAEPKKRAAKAVKVTPAPADAPAPAEAPAS